ncbi:MAG: caspase family protein, partial [Spirochaetota bacterium]
MSQIGGRYLKRVILQTVFMFLLASLYAQEHTPALKRFALIIGSNDGGRERPLLEYAASDAQALADLMVEIGGVEAVNSILLKNPGRKILDNAFTDLREKIEAAQGKAKRQEFILYYSGHSDEKGIYLKDELYPYEELKKSINYTGADVHIAILDSCFSGVFTRFKGGTKDAPFLMDDSVKTEGFAVLTSSSENEVAQESDTIGGSFFTHYLI